MTSIDWPTPDHTWWWMRWRPTRRSKWRKDVIVTVIVDGTKWVCPVGSTGALTRAICKEWEAQFVPASPPPEEWLTPRSN